MTEILIKFAAVLIGFVALWIVLRIMLHFTEAPKGTLWPDGQDEPPIKHQPSPMSFAKRRIPLTDLERRRVADRIVGIRR